MTDVAQCATRDAIAARLALTAAECLFSTGDRHRARQRFASRRTLVIDDNTAERIRLLCAKAYDVAAYLPGLTVSLFGDDAADVVCAWALGLAVPVASETLEHQPTSAPSGRWLMDSVLLPNGGRISVHRSYLPDGAAGAVSTGK
jgi:hypothetical protein